MNETEARNVYISALSKINSNKIEDIQAAITELTSILGYRDVDQRLEYCREKIIALENKKKDKKKATVFIIIAVAICAAAVAVFFMIRGMNIAKQENNANIEHYNLALSYLEENRLQEAALEFGKAGNYEDAQERSLDLWKEFAKPSVISIGTFTMNNFIIGLKSDGTVLATGRNNDGQCNVSDWNDIVSVSAGFSHAVGLKSDGTVVAVGSNSDGECNVSKWRNIVQVLAGDGCTIGLQSDGTLLYTGFVANGENDCTEWENIVQFWVFGRNAVGKTLDGEIISSEEYFNMSDNDSWRDLKEITYVDNCGVFGLTQDNSVIFDKWSHHPNDEPYYDSLGLDNAQYWTDVIDIDGGLRNIVGIKSDGTVVFAGSDEEGQNDISDWHDIVVISTEGRQTIGVKSDGTVLLVGDISWEIDVSQWNDIMIP